DRIAADALRTVLASRGVIVSSGSACASAPGADPAHAKTSSLDAIGLPPSWGMVRLSFGHDTTAEEVAAAAPVLATTVRELAGAPNA
ncbi:MAG TPA: aminotransferase class V-fold PLP-dependent enzyme, partial [Kofleriaceae bacterium]|nr:aminotransferase class V-fold PLP-dependent enzyme [Kofleriaceae bacterium]